MSNPPSAAQLVDKYRRAEADMYELGQQATEAHSRKREALAELVSLLGSQTEAADLLGITRGRVWQILKET